MSDERERLEELRAAFAAGADQVLDGGAACPAAGEIWDAAHGELDAPATRAIVEHTARCPACADDWRRALEGEGAAAMLAPPRRRRLRPLLAAAAVLAAALGLAGFLQLGFMEPEPLQAPVYREHAGHEIHSELAEGEALPRNAAWLRWSSAGDEARYDLRISTLDLEPVATARGLRAPEYLIPEELLAALPPGTEIVWRVEARLVDGRKISSPAFVHRLG